MCHNSHKYSIYLSLLRAKTYTNNPKAQIDCIFIKKKWDNNALNCEAYSYFKDVSFDH